MFEQAEVVLEAKHITRRFSASGGRTLLANHDINLKMYKGKTLGLVGESGCGKSTFMRFLVSLDTPSEGEILYRGRDITKLRGEELRQSRQHIQMVFQDPAASLNERATVDYIISEGLYNFHLFENEADRVRKVENMVNEVGLLPEHLTRYPHEFSGGQRQRIGLARAMVMEPELVVAYEPISALDVSIRAQVLNLLKKFQKERGTTYLFIAHDLSIVRFISDHIGVIYKGDIVEIATAEELFNYPLHPYTRSLISAIPIPDPELEKNKVLFTYDPSVHDYSEDKPEMTYIGHDHYIFGNKKEIEEYKAIREKGEPIKSVTIAPAGTTSTQTTDDERAEEAAAKEIILETPLHDTGSLWYSVGGFFLPITGLIAGAIFKHHKYIRNFKACRKGSIIGLILRGGLLLLFLICLLLALL